MCDRQGHPQAGSHCICRRAATPPVRNRTKVLRLGGGGRVGDQKHEGEALGAASDTPEREQHGARCGCARRRHKAESDLARVKEIWRILFLGRQWPARSR